MNQELHTIASAIHWRTDNFTLLYRWRYCCTPIVHHLHLYLASQNAMEVRAQIYPTRLPTWRSCKQNCKTERMRMVRGGGLLTNSVNIPVSIFTLRSQLFQQAVLSSVFFRLVAIHAETLQACYWLELAHGPVSAEAKRDWDRSLRSILAWTALGAEVRTASATELKHHVVKHLLTDVTKL